MSGDTFSLAKVSKYNAGEGIVPCPESFVPLTAAPKQVEHTDYEFNHSWLTAEAN